MGRAFEYRRASKEARWDKMSKLFPKLAKSITFAAKQGGLDPDMNPRLRTAIMNAKAQNMPKDNIDAAIKRAAGKDDEQFTEIVYEGKGPHGVLMMIECTTNNTNRSVADIKAIVNKMGGQIVTSGQMEYLFNRKAVIEIEKSDKIDTEELELELIDAGLEEIETTDEMIFIYGDYTQFGNLIKALEDKGIEPKKSSLQRIPTNPIELTEEQMEEVEKLIDKLEDNEDVQAVYTNIA